MIRLKTPYSFNENIHLLENIRAWLDMPIMTPEYQVLNAVIELLEVAADCEVVLATITIEEDR